MNGYTYGKTDKRREGAGRLAALSVLLCFSLLFLVSPLKAWAAAENQAAAPNEKVLFRNGSWETSYWGDEGRMAYRYSGSGEVTGKAPKETFKLEFTIDSPTLLRSVVTVHKNSQAESVATLKSVINGEAGIFDAAWPQTDGEIALTDEEGTVFGPFPCKIASPTVVNGEIQPYVLWAADTGELELQPGKYAVTDSRPETLVVNDGTGGLPAVLIKGVDAGMWQEYVSEAGSGRGFQGSYEVEVQDEFGNIVTDPVGFGMVDNGDSVEIVGMIADMPIDQKLGITSRTDDTIEAGGSVSLLPSQGLFELTINTTIKFENGEWVFSGEWNFSESVGGEKLTSNSTFRGRMVSRDMPGFFFPEPAAGLGSLGNIPGPANETQAAAGVVAPGLIALLASVIAGSGKTGGGSTGPALFMQPAGPALSGGGGAGPLVSPVSGGPATGEAAGHSVPTFSHGSSVTAGMNRGNAASMQSITLETQPHVPGMPDEMFKEKTSFVQPNSNAQHIQSMLDGHDSASGDALSQSIQKAMSQVVDTTGGNALNELSSKVANDIASGGLSDFGFSGGDMLKAAAGTIDADDMLGSATTGISAFQSAMGESKELQLLDILSRIFKPRTNLPEDLIKAAQNRANIR